jgi:hypothetical protein
MPAWRSTFSIIFSASLITNSDNRHIQSFRVNIHQSGDDVLRMLVTGGPPVRGGGGMPRRIVASSVPWSVLRITGAGVSLKTRRASTAGCRRCG